MLPLFVKLTSNIIYLWSHGRILWSQSDRGSTSEQEEKNSINRIFNPNLLQNEFKSNRSKLETYSRETHSFVSPQTDTNIIAVSVLPFPPFIMSWLSWSQTKQNFSRYMSYTLRVITVNSKNKWKIMFTEVLSAVSSKMFFGWPKEKQSIWCFYTFDVLFSLYKYIGEA
jgi:hypothetical protein